MLTGVGWEPGAQTGEETYVSLEERDVTRVSTEIRKTDLREGREETERIKIRRTPGSSFQ